MTAWTRKSWTKEREGHRRVKESSSASSSSCLCTSSLSSLTTNLTPYATTPHTGTARQRHTCRQRVGHRFLCPHKLARAALHTTSQASSQDSQSKPSVKRWPSAFVVEAHACNKAGAGGSVRAPQVLPVAFSMRCR